MKTVLCIIGLLCPLVVWSQETDIAIKYLGFGTQAIDNNLEYIEITLSSLNSKSCKVIVPLEVHELESTRRDNPFIKAQCLKSGKDYIESATHDTRALYRQHSYGGSRSSFSINLTLIDRETLGLEEFIFTHLVVEGKINRKYIGLDKS